MEPQVKIAEDRIREAQKLLGEIVGGKPSNRPWEPNPGTDAEEHRYKVVMLNHLDLMIDYIDNYRAGD